MLSLNEMKKIDNQKFHFENKKNLKTIVLKKFSPGSIISYTPSQHGTSAHYKLLTKEELSKFEGNEWINDNKFEMERLLSTFEDNQNNEISKRNLGDTFCFYDTDDCMKFDQVVENIHSIFN